MKRLYVRLVKDFSGDALFVGLGLLAGHVFNLFF